MRFSVGIMCPYGLTYLIDFTNSNNKIQRSVILFARSVIVGDYDFRYCLNDEIFIGRNGLLFVNEEFDAAEINKKKFISLTVTLAIPPFITLIGQLVLCCK